MAGARELHRQTFTQHARNLIFGDTETVPNLAPLQFSIAKPTAGCFIASAQKGRRLFDSVELYDLGLCESVHGFHGSTTGHGAKPYFTTICELGTCYAKPLNSMGLGATKNH